LWFEINCLSKENILFGVVYIPPEGSVYSNIDIFDKIERDISSYCSNFDNIVLLGDFNSRCGHLDDFVSIDCAITDDVFDIETAAALNRNQLQLLSFPIERHSKDVFCNNYGHRLVQLCKSFDVHFANGRCGSDAYVGELTCENAS